jgi:dsDNA-specific endonuclease/ATPase MutS2
VVPLTPSARRCAGSATAGGRLAEAVRRITRNEGWEAISLRRGAAEPGVSMGVVKHYIRTMSVTWERTRGGGVEMPEMLTVDLHPIFRSDRDIDVAVRTAIFRAAREKIKVVEIISGKGSGKLKRRVLATLNQPHLKKLYRRVEADAANDGRVLVHF